MKFEKQGISRRELAKLAISRGISGSSVEEMECIYQHISYYRLSGYWLQFKQPDETLTGSPSIGKILSIYNFDQKMRLLVLKSIQNIENTLRAMFIDYYATQHSDPFAYLSHAHFPNMTIDAHSDKIAGIRSEIDRSQALFVKAYRTTYCPSHDLPVWMAIEVASFSTLVYLCVGAENRLHEYLGNVFNLPCRVLISWLLTLRPLRNKCAHHERVWDVHFKRPIPYKPKAYKYPEWDSVLIPASSTLFFRILMLEHMIKVSPYADFSVYDEVMGIVGTYPEVPISVAGFPDSWRDCPVWG